MTVKTLHEQLAEVEAAITAALDKQRWQQGGRSEERPDLAPLLAERRRLERAIDRHEHGGMRVRRIAPLG